MSLKINSDAPNFEAETTHGKIDFYEWAGQDWVILFSHPKNFTPVCTTELGSLEGLKDEFDKRGVKIIGLSVDPVEDHAKWAEDIKDVTGHKPSYPLIGDKFLEISKLYRMLPSSLNATYEGRTPIDNQTVRNVFIIDPNKKIKLILAYPMSTGRNFQEILRVVDSLQLTSDFKVATPADWKQGEDVIIVPAVKDEDAKKIFPNGWDKKKPYLRVVKNPKS